MYLRKASSMIELVIAIVIMGIAMVTLPLMLTRVQSNNEFAMQQEAILMARTQLGDILTYPWDENSTDSSYNVGIIDTNGDSDFNRTNRKGLVHANKRRKFFTTPTPATAKLLLGKEGNDYNDLDDFIISDVNLTGNANLGFGYKVPDSNMSISVRYLDDNTIYHPNGIVKFDINTSAPLPAGTTNIKILSISLKNSLLDGNITLRAFSSNIGANRLLRRTFLP